MSQVPSWSSTEAIAFIGQPPARYLMRCAVASFYSWRNNLHAAVSAALTRMELVSREEFDVQAAVLARTREKLAALETKVAELERALEIDGGSGHPTRGG